jgi:hypothetical protein
MANQYLIVADVDHIQSYIFSSNQLRAVRGGSVLVEELGEKFRALRDADWRPLRWRGGQMVAIWSGTAPENLCLEIEKQAVELGGGALTITTVYKPYHGRFSNVLKEALRDIDTQKRVIGRPHSMGQVLSGGFVRFCDLCKTYPAHLVVEHDDQGQIAETNLAYPFGEGDERHLCLACQQRVKRRAEEVGFGKILQNW